MRFQPPGTDTDHRGAGAGAPQERPAGVAQVSQY